MGQERLWGVGCYGVGGAMGQGGCGVGDAMGCEVLWGREMWVREAMGCEVLWGRGALGRPIDETVAWKCLWGSGGGRL